jgi:hypothetical protein
VGFKIIGWGRFSTLTSPGPSSMVTSIGYVSFQEMVSCSWRMVSATVSEIIGRTRLCIGRTWRVGLIDLHPDGGIGRDKTDRLVDTADT